MGATPSTCAWVPGQRAALVIVGAGVIVQGLALLLLEIRFISSLSLAAYGNG